MTQNFVINIFKGKEKHKMAINQWWSKCNKGWSIFYWSWAKNFCICMQNLGLMKEGSFNLWLFREWMWR